MKTLVNYILEQNKDVDDYWYIEEFMDEDTGEIYNLLRMKDSPKMAAFLKQCEREEEKIQIKIDKLKKEMWGNGESAEIDDLQDQYDDAKAEYENARLQYNMKVAEMEEVAGEYQQKHDTTTKEGWEAFDNYMNEYGGEMDKLSEFADECEKKMEDIESKLALAYAQYDSNEDKRIEQLEAQIDELDKKLDKMRAEKSAKYDKMKEEWMKEHPAPEI